MQRKDSAVDDRDVSVNQRKERSASDNLRVTVLGVCTGTGLGHLDCALVRFGRLDPSEPLRVELQQVNTHCDFVALTYTASSFCLQFDQIAVPSSVKDHLASYLRSGQRISSTEPPLDELLGQLFAYGVKTFCHNNAVDIASIDLAGTYSKTLRHLATQTNVNGAQEHPLHWNSIVSAETGVSTVFDFTIIERGVNRSHIQPTAYVDRVFLRHPNKFRACLDIGELVRLIFIPPHSNNGTRASISSDVGPGSLLIDYATRYCTSNNVSEDREGRLGATGEVNQTIVDRFLATHDYLRQMPSLSIATEMFGNHEAQHLVDECVYSNLSEADTMATVTRVTAENIMKQYSRLLQHFFPEGQTVDEIFICGSSAHNSNIIDFLEASLPQNVITRPVSDIGIPNDAYEAVGYAYLALEAVLSQATQTNDTGTTQSSAYTDGDSVGARVVAGRGWTELLSHILAFSDGREIPVAKHVRVTGSLETAVENMNIN